MIGVRFEFIKVRIGVQVKLFVLSIGFRQTPGILPCSQFIRVGWSSLELIYFVQEFSLKFVNFKFDFRAQNLSNGVRNLKWNLKNSKETSCGLGEFIRVQRSSFEFVNFKRTRYRVGELQKLQKSPEWPRTILFHSITYLITWNRKEIRFVFAELYFLPALLPNNLDL